MFFALLAMVVDSDMRGSKGSLCEDDEVLRGDEYRTRNKELRILKGFRSKGPIGEENFQCSMLKRKPLSQAGPVRGPSLREGLDGFFFSTFVLTQKWSKKSRQTRWLRPFCRASAQGNSLSSAVFLCDS